MAALALEQVVVSDPVKVMGSGLVRAVESVVESIDRVPAFRFRGPFERLSRDTRLRRCVPGSKGRSG